MQKFATYSILCSLLFSSCASAQPMFTEGHRPVMISAMDDLDACSLGQITGAGQEGAVTVLPGDNTELELIDTLVDGEKVWICESSNDMLGIVYSSDSELDCEVSSPADTDRYYNGPCDSGWVKAEWVELLAG